MSVKSKIYKAFVGKQTPKSEKKPVSPRISKKSWEDLIADIEKKNEGKEYKYMNFLSEASSAFLYGTLRKAMNSESATPIDQFVNAVCFRAESINNGFLTLCSSGNFLCASSMIRMQLDTALICMAGLKCKKQMEFFLAFNEGTPINRLRDEEGNQLTQGFLVKSIEDPQIKEIFDNGNHFIHPSRLFQDESIDLSTGVRLMSYREYSTPDRIRKEAFKQMLLANNVLAEELVRWVRIKNTVKYK